MNFEKFGKDIYDTAMKNFIDNKGIKNVEYPIMHPEYGSITTVTIARPHQLVRREGKKLVSYYVLSDGTLKEIGSMDYE